MTTALRIIEGFPVVAFLGWCHTSVRRIPTRPHGDHFNAPTSRVLAEKSNCLFMLPRNCLEKAREFGIPQDRIRGSAWGQIRYW